MTPTDTFWGVDLGGTKIGFGTGHFYHEEPTALTGEGIVAQIVAATPPQARLGLCVAGKVDTTRGMTLAAQLPQLQDFPLVEKLAQAGRSCLLVNDADAAALAEYKLGAGQGAKTMLYVTVSTGIGGGLVTDGRLYQGANGQALEVGHAGGGNMEILCACGRRGCIDSVASGRMLLQRIREAAGQPAWAPQDIAQAAQAGNTLVLTLVKQAAEQLATVIASFCVLFNPDVLLLGGGVIRAYGDLYMQPFERQFYQELGEWMRPAVKQAALQERVGVLGAQLLVKDAAG